VQIVEDKVVNGITFTGGEPLQQADEVDTLMSFLPKSLDTMLFTGYTKDELNVIQRKCYDKFDLVVEGRYVEGRGGNYLWRGSDNQKFVSPSKKYPKQIIEQMECSLSKGIEVSVSKNKLFFYGIPTHNNEIKMIQKYLSLDYGILCTTVL